MEPLSWTGSLAFLNPFFLGLWALLGVSVIAQIVTSFFGTEVDVVGDQLIVKKTPNAMAGIAVKWSFIGAVLVTLAYLVGGIVMPGLEAKGIIGTMATRFLPVWIALIVTFGLSIIIQNALLETFSAD